MKTLDRAGRVKYISVSENHIKMSKNDMIKYIVPYLKGFGRLKRVDEVQKLSKQRLLGRGDNPAVMQSHTKAQNLTSVTHQLNL